VCVNLPMPRYGVKFCIRPCQEVIQLGFSTFPIQHLQHLYNVHA
jgi:hypothetical protein